QQRHEASPQHAEPEIDMIVRARQLREAAAFEPEDLQERRIARLEDDQRRLRRTAIGSPGPTELGNLGPTPAQFPWSRCVCGPASAMKFRSTEIPMCALFSG